MKRGLFICEASKREGMSKLMRKWVFFVPAIFLNCQLVAAVRILTFHYNHADFIELQYKTLQHFLSDEFELIVFNDAPDVKNEKEIADACEEYGIKCVRFQQDWHLTDPLNLYLKKVLEEPSTVDPCWGWNSQTTLEQLAQHPSVRHCHVIQYALDHYGYDHDDLIAIIDGDNFLIKPTSFRDLLGAHDFVGFSRHRDMGATYRKQLLTAQAHSKQNMWVPSVIFIAFNPSKLPNVRELKFHVDVISGHPNYYNNYIGDSGAAACRYIMKYPDLKIKEFYWNYNEDFILSCSSKELENMGFSYYLMQFMEDVYPQFVQLYAFEHFLHFVNVSSHRGESKKVQLFRKFIFDILGP